MFTNKHSLPHFTCKFMVSNFLQVECLRVQIPIISHSTHQFTPICKLWNIKFSMFCITYFWLCLIIAYIFTNCNTFSQNIFKNIFPKPIDKSIKICYSNKGSPSPIKKKNTNKHTFFWFRYIRNKRSSYIQLRSYK